MQAGNSRNRRLFTVWDESVLSEGKGSMPAEKTVPGARWGSSCGIGTTADPVPARALGACVLTTAGCSDREMRYGLPLRFGAEATRSITDKTDVRGLAGAREATRRVFSLVAVVGRSVLGHRRRRLLSAES